MTARVRPPPSLLKFSAGQMLNSSTAKPFAGAHLSLETGNGVELSLESATTEFTNPTGYKIGTKFVSVLATQLVRSQLRRTYAHIYDRRGRTKMCSRHSADV